MMAVVIGVLTAIVLILVVVVLAARYRQRKSFASPLASKAPLASAAEKGGGCSGTVASSSAGMVTKWNFSGTYRNYEMHYVYKI